MKLIRSILAFTLVLVFALRAGGQMVDPNMTVTPEALKEMEKAAKKGDYTVQLGLVSLYVMGAYGVDKNVDKALEWAKKARDKGLKDGDPAGLIVYLELLIMEEDNIPNAKGEIVTWGSRGKLMGNPMCLAIYGDWLVKKGEITDGLSQLNMSAFLGVPESMNSLTHLYLGNEGVPVDYNLAFKWATSSAELRNPQGMKNLAMMYVNGWGTTRDVNKAIEWGDKAMAAGLDCSDVLVDAYLASPDFKYQKKGFDYLLALKDQPNPVIWYNLGMCYEKGTGTEKNDAAAVQWYELAKMGEITDAETRLLRAELYGELGVEKNEEAALAGLDKLADEGVVSALALLDDWYGKRHDGKAMLKNLDRLETIMNKSPEKFLDTARNSINILRANIYADEDYGVKDVNKEKEYLKMVENDDSPAYHLAQGALLNDRKFGEPNYEKAIKHYEAVIDHPDASDWDKRTAYMKLSTVYRYGRGVELDEVKADRYLREAELLEKGMDMGDGYESVSTKMKKLGL